MEKITRANIRSLFEIVRQELTERGYPCEIRTRTDGFRGDFIVCKPFGDPAIKRAYEISIPTIFEKGKYVVGEAKRELNVVRCAEDKNCRAGKVIGKFFTRDPEKLREKIADMIEFNFVEPKWM